LRDLAEVDAVVLTRGAQGMTIYDPVNGESRPSCIPTAAREVFDVSGAGDTVVAVLSLALAGGMSVVAGARIANVAAGIVVGKRGTAVVKASELASALRALSGANPKIVAADAADAIVSDWNERGLRVGFTNGCFDLLHPGHVELLRQARASCDRLVVGLNSDASVRRLKGPTRPVQNENARSTVMASIGSVDLVILFEEDTPLELIQLLKPDVLIKGGDYTIDTVVGADLVQAYGGKTLIVPLEAGHSTTSIISRADAGDAR
jgi:D-beta-D-heptose 7-phosphate kinase/D-beta-D-heptose 1-phosphate adenosyltransferase